MNIELLRKHIAEYKAQMEVDPTAYRTDLEERRERVAYFQSWSRNRLLTITGDDLYDYLSRLWAMLIWGNKHYVVDKLIETHGLEQVRQALADLVWGQEALAHRWNAFRNSIKGVGPAMMSEILCHTHPHECMLWNRRAYVALDYLGISDLPRYNYQFTGVKYEALCDVAKQIAAEMAAQGIAEVSLLTVDYLIWHELQVEDNLSQIYKKPAEAEEESEVAQADQQPSDFIHDEIRDKLADIGTWLGLTSRTEVKVSDGSRVDAVWEQTIGNMGRVIYVFEVQTKGSIDSLILNLLKSMNNPAVQGVVAVSDAAQLEKIRNHAKGVSGLREKLKCWDYKQVLQVHEALEAVNESINSLGLVPQGF